MINNYLEALITMQTYNYNKDYFKAKMIYEKHNNIIPLNDVYLKNKFLNEYEIASNKCFIQSKPRSLYIELFDLCQLNCIMCNQRHTGSYLTEKYLFEITTLLPYLDTITWQGGELFLWNNFIQILKNISFHHRITQLVFSNFQSITNDMLKELVQINNIKLIVSIDSPYKKNYEKIRKGSSFTKLIRNINTLNKYRLKYKSNLTLHINFVILKENYNEILDMIEFAKKYSFLSISLNKCVNSVNYNSELIDTGINNRIGNILNIAIFKALKANIKINIQYPVTNQFKLKQINFTKLICKLPWYNMFISMKTFAPECVCLKRESYNKNDNLKIEDMWNSKLMQNYRKHILGIKQNNNICNLNCRLYNHYFN